ncbi:MAG: DNA-deoxyinosine glycosylase [Methanomicrobiales archaeon]|nr:DNA-deoxyinosine glycosylase [Methanomicrobiales archaeon]
MNPGLSRECGLPAIVGKNPDVLILGSFPSKMSLAAKVYYANPRNQFWRIMQCLVHLDDARATAENQDALRERHIAVWDVIASRAYQPGAMDRDIRDPVMNDIPAFLRTYPTIRCIGLNGGKAMDCFNKVTRNAPPSGCLAVVQLPSTSPAHATRSFAQKLDRWRVITGYLSPRTD